MSASRSAGQGRGVKTAEGRLGSSVTSSPWYAVRPPSSSAAS
jgi:hypothetical protein